jgi:hypothetical protein
MLPVCQDGVSTTQFRFFRPSQASLGRAKSRIDQNLVPSHQGGTIFVIPASESGLRPARGQATAGIYVQAKYSHLTWPRPKSNRNRTVGTEELKVKTQAWPMLK